MPLISVHRKNAASSLLLLFSTTNIDSSELKSKGQGRLRRGGTFPGIISVKQAWREPFNKQTHSWVAAAGVANAQQSEMKSNRFVGFQHNAYFSC